MEITSDFQRRAFLQTESLQKCGIALILLSSFAGAYGLHGLGWTGGMIQTLQGILNDPAGKFPGTDVLIIRKYTGATAVDVVLANMVPFFWPVVDGRYPPLTLFSFFMFGQYGVAWALFVMESLRKGNKKKVISYIGTFGCMMQTAGFGIITPIYLIIHLLTSPTAMPSKSKRSTSPLQISTSNLAVLPLSISLGYIFPSILIMLPSPSLITPEMRQVFLAVWQPFPIYTVICQRVLCRAHVVLSSYSKTSATKALYHSTSLSTRYLISTSRVYTFLITFCVLTHLPPLLITLCPSDFIYHISPRLESYITSSNSRFSSVYIPHAPLPSWRSSSLADAIHTFLLWDTYISGFATIIWAIILSFNTSFEQGRQWPIIWPSLPSHPSGSGGDIGKVWLGFLLRTLAWIVVAGPFGAVTILLWERDTIICIKEKVKQ